MAVLGYLSTEIYSQTMLKQFKDYETSSDKHDFPKI